MNVRAVVVAAGLLLLSGCVTHRAPPPPGSTQFGSTTTTLKAQVIDDFLIVETKGDRSGPFHFLIDTGTAVTMVAPDFARRYSVPLADSNTAPLLMVRSYDGRFKTLPAVTVSEIDLAGVRFSSIPAVLFDTTQFSADLGVHIDAILGFPFFHAARLTLDYPHSRVILRSAAAAAPAAPGVAIPFDDTDKTPVVELRLAGKEFMARLDSGSNEDLTINPQGLNPRFEFGPVPGQTPTTVAGDRVQLIGRLADTAYLATYPVPRPVAEVSPGMSAVGGGILKNFIVTFDPATSQVSFYRAATEPIAVPGRRSPGISFDKKSPAYWRIVGVVPGSPAAAAGVETGDLVTRIDGEPVGKWDLARYNERVANAERISFTFLAGNRESEKTLPVVDLVP
jgi:hypothetical protein